MNSPDILDFAALLQPIAGGRPTGEDPRSDSTPTSLYYRIKDARAAARAAERAGGQFEQGQQVLAQEWRTVLQLAPEVVATRAKDLEIVAWLIEGLVREHGFAGLRDGFRLARELVDRFWEGLYPQIDEDGVSTRVAPLAGLNGAEAEGTLAVPIAMVPITGDGDFGAFGLWRFAKVRDLAKTDGSAPKDGAGASAGTLEQFQLTVRGTDPDFYRRLIGDVDAAIEHFQQLTALLDSRCGHDSPPSSSIRNTLNEARSTIAHVVHDIAGVVAEQPAAAAVEQNGQTGTAQRAAAPANPGDIKSRDDAFRVLAKVAEYFRDHEPHSPLASVLYQALRWGRLPLAQLIDELIPDSSARTHFGLLTGLGPAVPANREGS